jgi:hypothetical protein
MTKAFAAYTLQSGSEEAGLDLGRQISGAFTPHSPDVVIVFASSRFDYERLLTGLNDTCTPGVLVGSSSAGEFTGDHRGEGTACALAISSTGIRAAAGVGQGVSINGPKAAADAVASFQGLGASDLPYRSALIMTDALAGHADELVRELTVLTSGAYQFAGGGAGDDAKFSSTHVFHGTRAYTDAVVALELLSSKPFGVGVGHGWTPASEPLRVTEVDGARLISLNGLPAVEAFEAHAGSTGQTIDRSAPLPFFLHSILGIDTGVGYQLRVPLAVNEDGSVTCAAEIPAGARLHIMKTSSDSAITAAQRATKAAIDSLHGTPPAAALFFDCVATRLRMGNDFGFELQSVNDLLGDARLVGCNTYGQIARAEGQFGGFHNCTAVVMVLPA